MIFSRLKLDLDDIIDQAHGAFVAGWSIMHNILLCQKFVKQYSRQHRASSFLKNIMFALNFSLQCTHIIMSYISFTSYVLISNGCTVEPIKAKRGLRQGDSLSLSFLLLVCNTFLVSRRAGKVAMVFISDAESLTWLTFAVRMT